MSKENTNTNTSTYWSLEIRPQEVKIKIYKKKEVGIKVVGRK